MATVAITDRGFCQRDHRSRLFRRHHAQPGRLAVEFGQREHAAAQAKWNVEKTVGENVDLHLPGQPQRVVARQCRLVLGPGQPEGGGRGLGLDPLVRVRQVPKLDELLIRHQQLVGVGRRHLPVRIVGHDHCVVRHAHRLGRLLLVGRRRLGFPLIPNDKIAANTATTAGVPLANPVLPAGVPLAVPAPPGDAGGFNGVTGLLRARRLRAARSRQAWTTWQVKATASHQPDQHVIDRQPKGRPKYHVADLRRGRSSTSKGTSVASSATTNDIGDLPSRRPVGHRRADQEDQQTQSPTQRRQLRPADQRDIQPRP